jgi:YfiH family protein
MGSIPFYIYPDWPAPKHVCAYSTTRLVGNLAQHVGDDMAVVAQNRERMVRKLNLPGQPVWLNQVHGTTGLCLDETLPDDRTADAAYSHQFNHICAVMTADCLPLLVTNQTGSVVAAIHAGWRGLLAGVIENTLTALKTPMDTLLVWLGPAIGPQVFEVGGEVQEAYIKRSARYESAFTRHKDRWLADLYELAKIALNDLGVTRIYGGGFCTYQQTALFYSYRREHGHTGRMASLIYIAPIAQSLIKR